MKMYKRISDFGGGRLNNLPVYNNDPLTYCLGNNISQRFNHGSHADLYGQNSKPCQVFLAQRCAKKWDDICEYASNPRTNDEFATPVETLGTGMHQIMGLNSGDILLRNTAMEKYRVAIANCDLRREAFEPMSPASPQITYFTGRYCNPIYSVNPVGIDNDPVMNRILFNPRIALDILINIKNTMSRDGTIAQLNGTRLGQFFKTI
jgi:hypothetical protein